MLKSKKSKKCDKFVKGRSQQPELMHMGLNPVSVVLRNLPMSTFGNLIKIFLANDKTSHSSCYPTRLFPFRLTSEQRCLTIVVDGKSYFCYLSYSNRTLTYFQLLKKVDDFFKHVLYTDTRSAKCFKTLWAFTQLISEI